ncbi:MAG TPA: FHA domain-containing protein, partial [Pyrinomonadaceae bacterium]|nr:FHA domain-containing protein [Pyrinomonadaceae bacterium]
MPALLKITVPNGESWEVDLAPDRSLTIGRAKDNDIILNDRRVSRKHARITRENGVFMIVDGYIENGELVRSVNHVFVNGSPMLEKRLLAGDTIVIGESKLVYVDDIPAPAVEPVRTLTPSRSRVSTDSAVRAEPTLTGAPSPVDYDDKPLGQT